MTVKILELAGKRWAVMPEKDYSRLAASADEKGEWPDLPQADSLGNYPAAEYARASLARKIIKARLQAGISQASLARLSDIRPETLNRIEKGKTTPDTATIAKIQRALEIGQSHDETSISVGLGLVGQPAKHDDDQQEVMTKRAMRDKLLEAINRLPRRLRLVLILTVFEEFSHEEVAKILNVSTETIEVWVCQTRKIIADVMKKELHTKGKATTKWLRKRLPIDDKR